MSSNVFANGNEISAKKSGDKVIAALPDVCLSPPSPPAGPVPVPYPNSSKSSDTSGGSKSVKIKNGEIGLKNKSNWKKSNGDEAATKSLGMGLVSHNIQGPTKHVAWSMDVKVEGYNVIRHMDLTTHNHINTGNADLNATQGQTAQGDADSECEALRIQTEESKSKLRNKSSDKTLHGKGTTVSSFQGPKGGGSAHNRNGAHEKLPNQFVAGGDMSSRHANQSSACPGSGHQHKGVRASGHAEARILDNLGGQPGKLLIRVSLVKSVDRNGNAVESRRPCGHCHRAMCAARSCGVDIWLCDQDGNQKQMTADHCRSDGDPNKPIPRGRRKKLNAMLGA